jgi:hypothetical protein
MTTKLTLSATVVVLAGGKATNVFIKAGPINVAKATLGGKWNEAQALTELKKLPKRFTPIGDGAVILRSFGIAA